MDQEKKSKIKRILFTTLRLVIAFALLGWLIMRIRIDKLQELDLTNILISLAAAILLMSLQVSSGAWRWKLLLGAQGIDMPLHRAILLSFQGTAFSLFMPGGALGGDVIKAAILAAETKSGKRVEGITTVALDRLIGMSALFILVLIIALVGFRKIMEISITVRAGIFALLLFCFIGILIVGALFFQDFVFRFAFMNRLRKKADILLKGKLSRILDAIALYRKERKVLLKAFLISILMVHPFLLSTMFVLLWGIESSCPAFLGSYLAIALGNSAAVIPMTPGGLGARDKIAQIVLISFGFNELSATLAPLCFSLTLIAVGLIGLICFALDSFRKQQTT